MLLRRHEAGWRATGGELSVRRRQTRFGLFGVAASLLANGEAQLTSEEPCYVGAESPKVFATVSLGEKSNPHLQRATVGGWRQNDGKIQGVKQGDLSGHRRRSTSEAVVEQSTIHRPEDAKSRLTGVRGTIVATKPGNSGGAKGSRKMDDE